jgi:hypothetical protein
MDSSCYYYEALDYSLRVTNVGPIRITNMPSPIRIANPSDKGFWKNTYIFAFGAYGWTRVLAYANSMDSALDECADWIEENAPGLMADAEVAEEYNRLITEAKENGEDVDSEEVQNRIREESEADTLTAGNASHYFHSWEVNIVRENPTRDELIAYGREVIGR